MSICYRFGSKTDGQNGEKSSERRRRRADQPRTSLDHVTAKMASVPANRVLETPNHVLILTFVWTIKTCLTMKLEQVQKSCIPTETLEMIVIVKVTYLVLAAPTWTLPLCLGVRNTLRMTCQHDKREF